MSYRQQQRLEIEAKVTVTRGDPPLGVGVCAGGKCYEIRRRQSGVLLGHVWQVPYVCERKPRGARFVTARWTSKRLRWEARAADGTNSGRWDTRWEAIHYVLRGSL